MTTAQPLDHGEFEVTVTDARGQLSELLDTHVRDGDVVFLTRYGRRVGAVVPADVAERLAELEDAYWSRRGAEAKREAEAAAETPISWAKALAMLEAADADEASDGGR